MLMSMSRQKDGRVLSTIKGDLERLWQIKAIPNAWLDPDFEEKKKKKLQKAITGTVRKCGYGLHQIIPLY